MLSDPTALLAWLSILTLLGGIIWKLFSLADGWNDAKTAAEKNTSSINEIAEDVKAIRGEFARNGGSTLRDRIDELTDAIEISRQVGEARHDELDQWRRDVDRRMAEHEANARNRYNGD